MNDRVQLAARPPFVYSVGLAISLGVTYAFSEALTFTRGGFVTFLAAVSTILGVAFLYWGWNSLAVNNVDPNFKPVKQFVVKGAFKYTRNPIYIGFTFLYIGILLFFSTHMLFITLPMILIYIRYGVISREEEYLTERFGDAYRTYQQNVGRWV